MIKEEVLEGEWIQGNGTGTGKGDSAHTPVEASDTLYSKQTVRLLFALSEGEVENEPPLIYLNKISHTNFSVVAAYRYGTADQTPINGFVETESLVFGGQDEIFNAPTDDVLHTPYIITTTPRIYSISRDYEATRVTLSLRQLRKVNDNGDMVGYSVSITIYTRITGGTWSSFITTVKSGKCSSPYSWDILVPKPDMSSVPSISTWEIGFIRVTQDDPNTKYMSPSFLTSIIGLSYASHSYPNTFLVALTLTNAEEFSGRVPDIVFRPKTIKIKYPDNYNPVLHTYSGTWARGLKTNLSGVQLKSYNCNPAWCLYDVLTRSKANGGLAIAPSDIDLSSFYNLGVYCDTQISIVLDGTTTTERRYELHNQFPTKENVPTFLMYLLSLCNANFTTDEFGRVSLMFDHAGQAITKQVTNTNVIDGIFTYSSNDIESRYSIANVTYNNPNDFGNTTTTTELDETLVARYGLQSIDIVLVGCMSEGQAKRKARWALYTNSCTPDFVSFKVLLAGMTYQVGELVNIYDNYISLASYSGTITQVIPTGTSDSWIVLDRAIVLPTGSFSISYYDLTGTVVSKTITETNTTTDTVTINSRDGILTGSPFIISSATTGARVFKVVKIEMSDNIYTILCSQHNESKYNYIDSGVTVTTPDYDFTSHSNFTCPAVDIITVEPKFFVDRTNNKSVLHVVWTMPSGTTIAPKYKFGWKRDNQQVNIVENLSVANYDILDPIAGTYELSVWAINPTSGITSSVKIIPYNYKTSLAGSTLLPPTDVYVTGTTGPEFSTADLSISFKYNIANDTAEDTLQDYIVEVADTNFVVKGTYNIPVLARSKNFINNIGYTANVSTATNITKVTLASGVVNVTKEYGTSGSADSQSYFSTGVTGHCRVRFQFLDMTKACTAGLNNSTDYTTTSGLIDYRISLATSGVVTFLVGTDTTPKYTITDATTEDIFEVEWTGTSGGVNAVNYIRNGVILYHYILNDSDTNNTAGSLTNFTIAYADSVFLTTGSGLKNFTFGTFDTSTNLGGTFRLPFETNRAIFGTPTRNFKLRIYSRDLVGDLSLPVTITVNNPKPATSEFTPHIINGVGTVHITIDKTNTASPDIAGFRVWQKLSSDSSFTPSDANWKYDGSDSSISLTAAGNAEYTYYIAAYDTFDKTSLNLSSGYTGTPLSMEAVNWAISSGIVFTTNASTHVLSWTSGTILRDGTSFSINSGSVTWSSGTKYIYFNPNTDNNNLQTTNTLATAVGVGCFPIATYTGGDQTTVKGGSGDGFISGSQIIAGTVGASQIIAGSITATELSTTNAIITGTAQIADGIITDAKIGNLIKSLGFNPTNAPITVAGVTYPAYSGWAIDKTGDIISYGNFTLKDNTGTTILSSGGIDYGSLTNKTGFASISQINHSNASTYITDLAVDTLQIAGNAVSFTVGSDYNRSFSGHITPPSSVYLDLCSLSVDMTGGSTHSKVIIQCKIDGVVGYAIQVRFAHFRIIDEAGTLITSLIATSGLILFITETNANKTYFLQVLADTSSATGTGSAIGDYSVTTTGSMVLTGIKSSV